MHDPAPEFSRPIAIETVLGGPVRQRIAADQDECRRLASRFGLPAIDSLSANVSVEARGSGSLIVVTGTFEANVTQTCVVTLDPLPRRVSESFVAKFAAGTGEPRGEVVEFDPDAEDEPDPLEGESIDVGELVAQHLSLALDPHPRAENARLEAPALAADEPVDDGPFAALAKLKPKT